MHHYYHCLKTNKIYNKLSNVCQPDLYYEYIEILYDYEKIKKLSFKQKIESLKSLLPLKHFPISLGEGRTPLIKIDEFSTLCKSHQVYVKNEAQNPTGSFKDRESAIVISKAKELKYKKVFIVSSGNAALSAAVYCNKTKIKCECFIPKHTSKAKKQMLKLYNADFHLMNGDYESIYRQVIDNPPREAWNVTGGQNFFREEGSKRIAYEIWHEIKVPDVIIAPIGNGTLFSAIYKGFKELKDVGLTDAIPKMIGVQIKKASPIKEALKQNKDYVVLDQVPDSIAEGIIARESYSSPKAIRSIKESRGEIIEVTDQETIQALRDIIRIESLMPEPTSATVYAALRRLNFANKKNLNIVCIQTGNGMKNLEEVLKLFKSSV